MRHHHRYDRAIATAYGPVRVAVPVFRRGQCRQMAGGAALLGAEVRYQRFSKNSGHGFESGGAGFELRPSRSVGGLCQKRSVSLVAAVVFDPAPVARGGVGTGWFVDPRPAGGGRELKVIPDETGAVW